MSASQGVSHHEQPVVHRRLTLTVGGDTIYSNVVPATV